MSGADRCDTSPPSDSRPARSSVPRDPSRGPPGARPFVLTGSQPGSRRTSAPHTPLGGSPLSGSPCVRASFLDPDGSLAKQAALESEGFAEALCKQTATACAARTVAAAQQIATPPASTAQSAQPAPVTTLAHVVAPATTVAPTGNIAFQPLAITAFGPWTVDDNNDMPSISKEFQDIDKLRANGSNWRIFETRITFAVHGARSEG
jgi:hypothetical protein